MVAWGLFLLLQSESVKCKAPSASGGNPLYKNNLTLNSHDFFYLADFN